MSGNKSELTLMLVGNSRSGKSAFIQSFMAEEDRKVLDISGKGQTTRTFGEYTIGGKRGKGDEDDLPTIQVFLKNEESFTEERKKKLLKAWHEYISTPNPYDIDGGMKEALIEDEEFFRYQEFKCGDDISRMYDECFPNSFWVEEVSAENGQPDSDDPEEEENELSAPQERKTWYVSERACQIIQEKLDKKEVALGRKKLLVCFTWFFQWVYRKCRKELKQFCDDEELTLKESEREESEREGGLDQITDLQRCSGTEEIKREKIRQFFKSVPDERSFSALVEKIHVGSIELNAEYETIFKQLKLEHITFIDTLGLNHESNIGSEKTGLSRLEENYRTMLGEKYPRVDAVLFICKATAVKTEIDEAFAALFTAAAFKGSYIVFNKFDEVEGREKVIDDLKKGKGPMIRMIKNALSKVKPDPVFVEHRINTLKKYHLTYCSDLSRVNEPEKREELRKGNIDGLLNLLYAILNKRHEGDAKIDIGHVREWAKELLTVETVLSKDSKVSYRGKYQSWTSKYLKENLEQGRLYSLSPTNGYVGYWGMKLCDDYLAEALKNAPTPEEADPIMFENLRIILEDYLENHIGCKEPKKVPDKRFELYTKECDNCNQKECLLRALYRGKKQTLNTPCKPNYAWFTEVYDLTTVAEGEYRPAIQASLEALANGDTLIAACREHNAKVLAEELFNSTQVDKELSDFIRDFDPELEEDDDERQDFCQMVYENIYNIHDLVPSSSGDEA